MVRNKVLIEPARLAVSLVAGAGPEFSTRVAAGSPTFGRLFEGTDQRSPGQTSLYYDNPVNERHTRHVFPASPTQSRRTPPKCCRTVGTRTVKLLTSGNAVSDWNGAPQRSEDSGSASSPDNLWWLSRASIT
jgi:hypothetical protein